MYVNDNYCPCHSKKSLTLFTPLTIGRHYDMQFTVEKSDISFLLQDGLITRVPTDRFGYSVYDKLTLTNGCFHAPSLHHSIQKHIIQIAFKTTSPTQNH